MSKFLIDTINYEQDYLKLYKSFSTRLSIKEKNLYGNSGAIVVFGN